VGAEKLVGLCVEGSIELVVGVLGILKAGAAYVALDASYPRQRLQYMVRDAGPELVLTQEHLQGLLSGIERPVVVLERQRAEIGRCSKMMAAVRSGWRT
jgi:non-ribosomal peptide synthetase component F